MIRIEIIEIEDYGFTICMGDQIALWCGRDEALGVVAAALFSSPEKIPYLRSYESVLQDPYLWREKPVAFLTDQRVTSDVAIRFKPDPRRKQTYPFRIFAEHADHICMGEPPF